MNKLIQAIEGFRQKLSSFRRHCVKETPTRTIVIDPLLEALGWDVRDPDEVQLEYPTVDGKSVDYALKLNKKPVLLVEAKALTDRLDDVKCITQVVGYAANDGVVWCILTNGIMWRVYRSIEECAAPDKLMFEVSLDPNADEGMSVEQIAKQMWRFSREEMAMGTLDALGEQTFTDGKVRKALHALMIDPPRALLNLLKKQAGDDKFKPQEIKRSLSRISGEMVFLDGAVPPSDSGRRSDVLDFGQSQAPKRLQQTRRAKKGESPFDEPHHISGKPQEAVALYRSLDRFCASLDPAGVTRRYLAKHISYDHEKRAFCSVHVLQSGLRVWIKLKYDQIETPPSFARDVANVGHWGTGDVELRITNRTEFEQATDLIRHSFESIN